MMKHPILLLLCALAFGCQQNPSQPGQSAATEAEASLPPQALNDLFEEVNVVKMHLFATSEAKPTAAQYPYVGQLLTAEARQFLADELQPTTGDIYGCYRTENSGHYVLRVPGKYVSGDLALAKWDAESGKLAKVTDLAYRWCDEGACNQQDAWLTDLDDSRTLELITRSYHLDKNGMVSDEQFTVMTDSGDGTFKPAGEALASLAVPANYVMH